MGWLARFSPKSKPTTVAKELSRTADNVDIIHRKWVSPRNGFSEDLFVNPDQNSPVAAVIVGRSAEYGSINIGLISRKGNLGNTEQAMEVAGLSFGGMAIGLGADIHATCQELGVSIDKDFNLVLLAHEGAVSDEGRKQTIAARGQKVVLGLRDTSLLSDDATIRNAIVDKMSEELSSMRALGDDSQQRIRG